MSTRSDQIKECLIHAFAPLDLSIVDQSHLHAGHAGARDGRGHFAVTIVASDFCGIGRVQRHQMIYAALGDLMTTDIHALQINALAPSDQEA